MLTNWGPPDYNMAISAQLGNKYEEKTSEKRKEKIFNGAFAIKTGAGLPEKRKKLLQREKLGLKAHAIFIDD